MRTDADKTGASAAASRRLQCWLRSLRSRDRADSRDAADVLGPDHPPPLDRKTDGGPAGGRERRDDAGPSIEAPDRVTGREDDIATGGGQGINA